MIRWRAIAGAAVLGALVLPARDQWRAGSFALHTWERLRAAGRGSPASDLDRYFARLSASLAQSRVAGLLVTPALGPTESQRVTHQIQYALAPCILVTSTDADLVIVIGPAGAATPEPDAKVFELQEQFSDELRLYRRRAR